jgi:hypothetical protein
MANGISSVTHTSPVAQTANPAPPKPSQAPKQPAPPTDSVKLSQTAQAAAAQSQELIETPAQTSKEAQGGDLQAKRLLASEAAAHPPAK